MRISEKVLGYKTNSTTDDYYNALSSLKEESRIIKANMHLLFVLNTICQVKEIIDENPSDYKNLAVSIFKFDGNTIVEIINYQTGEKIDTSNDKKRNGIIYSLDRGYLSTHDFCGSLNHSSSDKPIVTKLDGDLEGLEKTFISEEILAAYKYELMKKEMAPKSQKDRKMKL